MKISDLLDVIQDDTVPIREKDIIASERIVEVTMAKIDRNTADGAAKRKLSRGAAAAIVIAACLAVSATALAAGSMGRIVNWQGETVGQEETVSVTPPPGGDMTERAARAQAVFDEADSTDFVLVRFVDENGAAGVISSEPTRAFSSVEELRAALTKAGSELRVFTPPDGYTLRYAEISYDCAAGYAYTPVPAETDDGLVVERYVLPEEGRIISGCRIEYRDADGHSLYLAARLTDGDVEFSLGENKTVASVAVSGMDSALTFEQKEGETIVGSSIEMSQTLSMPISYESRMVLTGAHPVEGGDVFRRAWYSVYGSGMDAETLLALLDLKA